MSKVIEFKPKGDGWNTYHPTRADMIKFKLRGMKNFFNAIIHFKFKKLVAVGNRFTHWTDSDDSGLDIEDVTFYLYENIFGVRSYKVHKYGFIDVCGSWREHLGPIKAWVDGAAMPDYFKDPSVPLMTVREMKAYVRKRDEEKKASALPGPAPWEKPRTVVVHHFDKDKTDE